MEGRKIEVPIYSAAVQKANVVGRTRLHFALSEARCSAEVIDSSRFTAFDAVACSPLNEPNLVSFGDGETLKRKSCIMSIHKRCIVLASIGIVGVTGLAGVARAENAGVPLYPNQEVSLDLFGSVSVGQQTIDSLSGTRVTKDGRLGTGVGLNYFFCRFVGLMGEAYTENTAHDFVDSASLNLVGRLPLGNSGIAPYIYGGGGHQFDNVEQNVANVGAGVEFRFRGHWGIFLDGRYVLAHRTDNYGVGRAGVRFSF